MKIAIAGAGAMGCRFGYMLTKAGQDVVLIDEWPAHIEAIRTNGLQVVDGDTTDTLQIPIYRPEEVHEEVDVVIAFTKSMKLGEMLEKIKAIVKTFVLDDVEVKFEDGLLKLEFSNSSFVYAINQIRQNLAIVKPSHIGISIADVHDVEGGISAAVWVSRRNTTIIEPSVGVNADMDTADLYGGVWVKVGHVVNSVG